MTPNKYPTHRKKSVEHWVKGHKRLGAPVKNYKRGSGKGSIQRKSRIVGDPREDSSSIGVHGFVFNFKYSDKPGDGETITIFSDDCARAKNQ